MKYDSDKYKGDPYGMIVVPDGACFDGILAVKDDKEIGDKVNKILGSLAEENDLKGVWQHWVLAFVDAYPPPTG